MPPLLAQICQYGIIFDDEKRFLVIRLSRKAHPSEKWIFPGGRLDEGEGPIQGLGREIKEETSLDVEIEDPCGIGMWDEGKQHRYAIYFICKTKGERKVLLSDEHQDLMWHPMDDINEIDFRDPSMKEAVKRAGQILNIH